MSSSNLDFSAAKLDTDRALRELEINGMLIIRNSIDTVSTSRLQARMQQETASLIERDFANFTRYQPDALGSPGHLGFLPPLADVFIDRSVVLPDAAAAITSVLLGTDFYLHEWVVNLNLAGNRSEQKAHRDEPLDPLGRLSGVIMHIATHELSSRNGMTLFWIGSHKFPFDQSCDPSGHAIPFRSVQPELLPGDILVRDLALLHKGVSNSDTSHRYLPALVFNPEWYKNDPRVTRPIEKQTFDRLDPETKTVLRKHPVLSNPVLNSIPYPIG